MSTGKLQMVEMTLGHRLRMVRDTAGLSREEIAEKLGVTPATIGRYEKGERTPDAEFLHQLVVIYGCDPSWLIMGGGSMWGEESKHVNGQEKTLDKDLLLTVLEAFEDAQKMHWYDSAVMTPRNQTALIYTLCVLFSDSKLRHLATKEFITGQAGFIYLLIVNPGSLTKIPGNERRRLDIAGLSDELNLLGMSIEILSAFMAKG